MEIKVIGNQVNDNRCQIEAEGMTLNYWAPSDGGYVREVSSGKPGTLGQQVGRDLSHSGAMLEWNPASHGTLADLIRSRLRTKAARENLASRIETAN